MQLEAHGFGAVPRFLGIDGAGREILSFLPGSVPDELGDFTSQQLAQAARLLRAFHDAAALTDLVLGDQVVCHGDFSPCNCVFVGELPVAIIDFDTAHVGRRLEDLGYAAWLWLRLGDADLAPEFQARRIAAFFEAYGTPDAGAALTAIVDAQRELARRSGAPQATIAWAKSSRDWVTNNAQALAAFLPK